MANLILNKNEVFVIKVHSHVIDHFCIESKTKNLVLNFLEIKKLIKPFLNVKGVLRFLKTVSSSITAPPGVRKYIVIIEFR